MSLHYRAVAWVDLNGLKGSLRTDVSVLYVDPRGPYPGLVADWYDATRDARAYAGPNRVIAHPPCGPWGNLRHLDRSGDATLAPHAVNIVRRFGGVLEHPSGSKLWAHCGLPRAGEPADAFGGFSFEVCQVDWGHVARKRTWLYVVRPACIPPMPLPREPTHWVSGRTHCLKAYNNVPAGIKICGAEQRRRTPIAFARWLIWMVTGRPCV